MSTIYTSGDAPAGAPTVANGASVLSAVEPTEQTEATPSRNPAEPLYDYVKRHVVVLNNVCLASGTLVAVLDFLAPRLWMAPAIIYSATAGLLVLMVAAAAAPAFAGRLISGMGYRSEQARGALWRKPLWQCCVAILAGVSIAGFASVAKADRGGLIASAIPAARSLQESMLGLRRDIADIRTGVDSANAKLDGMVARSADPRRDLASLGYAVDSEGLMSAIKQHDRRAVGLFVQAGLRVDQEGPLAVLLSGEQPWDGEIAAMLPRSMFAGKDACQTGFQFTWEAKPPVAERIEAFKRLCDPAPVVASIRSQVERDKAGPPLNEEMARQRMARKRNLAALES